MTVKSSILVSIVKRDRIVRITVGAELREHGHYFIMNKSGYYSFLTCFHLLNVQNFIVVLNI